MCEFWAMAQTVSIILNSADRDRLDQIIGDRNRPLKHVLLAKVVLLSSDRLPVLEVARRAGVSRPAVWRWQQRFMEEGVDGLLRDKTRLPGKKPLGSMIINQVLTKTATELPPEATQWSGRAMAKAVGISLRSVQRIWTKHDLKPHFAEKLVDIVGLYLDPPDKALVLAVDEKSQIQALDRTQPGLPLKKGRAGTLTHDYKRNGTTTLFAALSMLDGTVIGQCMDRHRHQEFIKFLRKIDRGTPVDLDLHLIADNYATHKHPDVVKWLERHPRFHLHFIPTSSSWLNLVERFFAEITRKRIRRGVFKSVLDLEVAIYRYLGEHNDHPKRFVWTKTADKILEKVERARSSLKKVVGTKC